LKLKWKSSGSIGIPSISFEIGWFSVIRPTVFEIKIDEICIDSSCLEKDVILEKTNASEYSFVQIQRDAQKILMIYLINYGHLLMKTFQQNFVE